MERTHPGTRAVLSEENPAVGLKFLSGVFAVTSGLTLSQVKELSGVEAPALQNWIKRGWVSSPVGKRYNIDQVARILIINMLRDTLQMEKIAFLLSYINGSVYSREDDIIPESQLYDYICRIIFTFDGEHPPDSETLRLSILEQTRDYEERLPGSGVRLRKALQVILLSYFAARLKGRAEGELALLREE